jgi:transposase
VLNLIFIESDIVDNKNTRYEQKTKLRGLIFSAYFEAKIDIEAAVARLNISVRQFYRLQNKYTATNTLTHGLCNKISNRSISKSTKMKALELYKNIYRGWNYEHFHDILLDRHEINISPCTLRKWLLDAKLSLPKRRKPKKYERREPRAKFNEMLQLDGTFADFLGDGRMLCLMHLVDDATKTSLAMLFEAECTDSAFRILYEWCLKYGVPQSIYCDKHSTYKVNEKQKLTIEEELEGIEIRLSEFGKVCDMLGIEQIFAHSPQAKGRVERKHNLYKDRCIKELKLDGIKTIETANAYLAKNNGFVDKLNNKFTIEAREARTAFVLPTPAELAEQFTINNTRTVRNDYTVTLYNVVYQLSRSAIVNARGKVIIKKYLDGHIAIFASNKQLNYHVIENYVTPIIEKNPHINKTQIIRKYTPAIDHPYRQQYKPEKLYHYASGTKQLQELGRYYGG